MNYSIQFENTTHSHITVTPRKKALKHSLLTVTQGIALIKVGKNEYAVESGQYFWVPADCLVSTTFLVHSSVSIVTFSQRLSDPFTNTVGYIEASDITVNTFKLLSTNSIDVEYQKILLEVVRHEMKTIQPKLTMNDLNQQFNTWLPHNNSGLTAEIHLSLKLREARKRLLSGQKTEQVASSIFHTSCEDFHRLFEFGFGMPPQ